MHGTASPEEWRDSHDLTLLRNVRPPGWTNPEPAERYNIVVIGGGTAGLVTAAGAAGLGGRVALVERDRLGGDCLNVGCVPSKALLRCARAVADVRDAHRFGVRVPGEVSVDFAAIMERMRSLRARISPHDSAGRFREMGVDVFLGDARFTGPDTLRVDTAELRFSRACIATGTHPAVPPVEGLEETGYLTNESVFGLTELPARLLVLGAGPVGCELAQAFARFGSQVTLVDVEPRLLPLEEAEAAWRVHLALEADGVDLRVGHRAVRVEARDGARVVTLESDAGPSAVETDAILVAVGRTPNVEGLGLEDAGVSYDRENGIEVDDKLRTSNHEIYAAGDVCSRYKFTHAADAMARVVIQNALYLPTARASAPVMPWCTYTDPELAHVGLYLREAEAQGIEAEHIDVELGEIDRAVIDGETDGLLRVVLEKGTDKILGATLVARHAGDMISELTLAIQAGVGLTTIAETVHPYPTQSEVIKRAADEYNRHRLTPFVERLSRKWLEWRR